nr:hypothetical protein [Tanacetum cinerariifolium]
MASKNLMQMSTDIVKLDQGRLVDFGKISGPELNRFDGESFKRWQKKMQFLLATLKVAHHLTKPYPEESENETVAASRERLKFENDDFICRGHILNAMSDLIFDVYQNYSMAKELWKALEERYFTEEATNSMLYMGNHSTAQVKGKGKIDLVFTSGNTLTLKNVLHVPDVRKNLVFGSLLNKFGFKLVFEFDKFILSKGGKFVGKGYHTGGMFKLNIKDVVNSSVNDVNMTEISDANDASAGHVYLKRMRNMANANLIPKLDSKNDKCQTCMHTKITRLPFPTIQRSSKILELVHSDVCDLYATPKIGGKKDARFDENRFRIIPMAHEISKETVSTEIPITTERNKDDSFLNHQKVEPRRSIRQRRQRTFGHDFEMYLVEGDRKEQVQMRKKLLSENFDMKDLGEADVILGIKIIRKENRLMLTQSHYIEKILKRFDSFNRLPVSTPFEVGSKLSYNTSRILAQNKYAKVIDSLMYAMICTKPNIAYAVGRLNYASTSGWIFTLGGGVVSWGSKKQSCLTDSTMGAEFVALASCCKEAKWLRDLLINIPLWPKPMPPISVHCDSKSTLSKVYNQVYNGNSRHIGLRHRQVNQLINDGVIIVSFLRSSKNLADPFTKGLPRKLNEISREAKAHHSNIAANLIIIPGYGNILDNVHLSEYESEAASYELKGLALKHFEKQRYRPKARLNGSAQSVKGIGHVSLMKLKVTGKSDSPRSRWVTRVVLCNANAKKSDKAPVVVAVTNKLSNLVKDKANVMKDKVKDTTPVKDKVQVNVVLNNAPAVVKKKLADVIEKSTDKPAVDADMVLADVTDKDKASFVDFVKDNAPEVVREKRKIVLLKDKKKGKAPFVVKSKVATELPKVTTKDKLFVVKGKVSIELSKDKHKADLPKDKPKPKEKHKVDSKVHVLSVKGFLSKEDHSKKKLEVKMVKGKMDIDDCNSELDSDEVDFDSLSDEAKKLRRLLKMLKNIKKEDSDEESGLKSKKKQIGFSSFQNVSIDKITSRLGRCVVENFSSPTYKLTLHTDAKPLEHGFVKLWANQFYPKSLEDIRVGDIASNYIHSFLQDSKLPDKRTVQYLGPFTFLTVLETKEHVIGCLELHDEWTKSELQETEGFTRVSSLETSKKE